MTRTKGSKNGTAVIDAQLNISLTAPEREEIRSAAKRARKSVSAWARDQLVAAARRKPLPDEDVVEIVRRYAADLRRERGE